MAQWRVRHDQLTVHEAAMLRAVELLLAGQTQSMVLSIAMSIAYDAMSQMVKDEAELESGISMIGDLFRKSWAMDRRPESTKLQ
jgi:hypothetical protein